MTAKKNSGKKEEKEVPKVQPKAQPKAPPSRGAAKKDTTPAKKEVVAPVAPAPVAPVAPVAPAPVMGGRRAVREPVMYSVCIPTRRKKPGEK